MYHKRFRNRKARRIFNLQGRFSLMHLGGGEFLYSFPGKDHPIVGKVELGRKKYRAQGIGLLALSSFFVGFLTIVSNAGTATAMGDDPALAELDKSKLTPEELDIKSEEFKSKIINEDDSKKKDYTEYTIKVGDTLSSVANRYKIPAHLVANASKISTTSMLRPGGKLRIPNRPGLMYKFKSGDSLASIAQYYTVSLESVEKDNPELADMDLIAPGTKVFLPNAKIPDPPPVWFRPIAGRVRFTSGFGWRRNPFYGTRQLHTGVDIALYYGSVKAARTGTVVYAGYLGSYGKAIVIQHGSGLKTLYAHLSSILVSTGQSVEAGKQIAISGNTGLSTGPHLHFEVIRNGKPVNPRLYVKF